MTEAEMLAALLDPGRSGASQSDTLDGLLALYEGRAAELGGGHDLAVFLTKEALRGAAPDEPRRRALAATLLRVKQHHRRVHVAECEEVVAKLRTLAPGSRIAVRCREGERLAVLLAVKRTRFVARLDDGRDYDFSAALFVRVADDAAAASQHAVTSPNVE